MALRHGNLLTQHFPKKIEKAASLWRRIKAESGRSALCVPLKRLRVDASSLTPSNSKKRKMADEGITH